MTLIQRAGLELESAALAHRTYPPLYRPAFQQLLGDWLLRAADREKAYRRENPGWDPADDWEEAWTAGLLACCLLGRDPADYDITPPAPED